MQPGLHSKSWPVKIGLALLSFFLFTFFLFCLIQYISPLRKALGLSSMNYFAQQDRYLKDPDLIFRTKPGYVYNGTFAGDLYHTSKIPSVSYTARFDEEGFRNAGNPGPKQIVVLGDSFIQFGFDDQDSLPARLQRATGLSAANYGMEWYGPAQYVAVLKKFAVKRQPRFAVLCFFEGNDLRDTEQYLKWKNGGNYYHLSVYSANPISAYFNFWYHLIYEGRNDFRKWDPRTAEVTLPTGKFKTIFTYALDTRPKEEILKSPAGRELEKQLKEFKDFSVSNGITPVLVFIPSSTHIYLPYGLPSGNYPGWPSFKDQLKASGHLEDAVRETAETLKLDFVDLTPNFKKSAAEGQVLFYPHDTHWTETGRALAASVIRNGLARLMSGQDYPAETPASIPAQKQK